MSNVILAHAEGPAIPIRALLEAEVADALQAAPPFLKAFAGLSEFKGKAGQLMVAPDAQGAKGSCRARGRSS